MIAQRCAESFAFAVFARKATPPVHPSAHRGGPSAAPPAHARLAIPSSEALTAEMQVRADRQGSRDGRDLRTALPRTAQTLPQ